jgi:RNA polymerase sigma-70 factor (ECF subfamily)
VVANQRGLDDNVATDDTKHYLNLVPSPPVTNSGEDANRDLELVTRVARGDEAAFEELVGKYQHSVLNTIHRYVGDYDAADDIAQEVFVILWNKAGTFKGNSKFSTWLYRIAVNQCLMFRRKRKPGMVSLDGIAAGGELPEALQVSDDHARAARIAAVKQAVAALPERQRMALVLSHIEGMTYQEIAEIMGGTTSAVDSLITRAKENLRNSLQSANCKVQSAK